MTLWERYKKKALTLAAGCKWKSLTNTNKNNQTEEKSQLLPGADSANAPINHPLPSCREDRVALRLIQGLS